MRRLPPTLPRHVQAPEHPAPRARAAGRQMLLCGPADAPQGQPGPRAELEPRESESLFCVWRTEDPDSAGTMAGTAFDVGSGEELERETGQAVSPHSRLMSEGSLTELYDAWLTSAEVRMPHPGELDDSDGGLPEVLPLQEPFSPEEE